MRGALLLEKAIRVTRTQVAGDHLYSHRRACITESRARISTLKRPDEQRHDVTVTNHRGKWSGRYAAVPIAAVRLLGRTGRILASQVDEIPSRPSGAVKATHVVVDHPGDPVGTPVRYRIPGAVREIDQSLATLEREGDGGAYVEGSVLDQVRRGFD